MDQQDGYRWCVTPHGTEWRWAIRTRDHDAPVVTGTASTRAQAAACVVRALICGVVEDRSEPAMAA